VLQELLLLDNIIKNFGANIDFHTDSDSHSSGQNKEKFWKYGNKEKWGKVDYRKFQNAGRYQTGEPIYEICEYCGKKKCSCGGCRETHVYKWVGLSTSILPCQRCICDHETEIETEILNDTGKSLDELVKERRRRGKPLREFIVEAYENGEITKKGKLRRRQLKGESK
jgi:hypothetical protein